MGAVDVLPVGRKGEVTGAASGNESLDFFAALQINDGDVVAQTIGGIERAAFAIGDDADGLETGG